MSPNFSYCRTEKFVVFFAHIQPILPVVAHVHAVLSVVGLVNERHDDGAASDDKEGGDKDTLVVVIPRISPKQNSWDITLQKYRRCPTIVLLFEDK